MVHGAWCVEEPSPCTMRRTQSHPLSDLPTDPSSTQQRCSSKPDSAMGILEHPAARVCIAVALASAILLALAMQTGVVDSSATAHRLKRLDFEAGVRAASNCSSAPVAAQAEQEVPEEPESADESDQPEVSDGPVPPWSEAWNNSVAICVIMRDENVTDVREWLQYHRWIGVDKVFLTNHVESHALKKGIKDFIKDGFVDYREENTEARQLLTYSECMGEHRSQYNWMAFIDTDEYINLRQEPYDLKAFMAEYKFHAALAMQWIMMGANGRKTRPPKGGVLTAYTSCKPESAENFKVITNTYYWEHVSFHPHNYMYKDLMAAVNEDHEPLPYVCDANKPFSAHKCTVAAPYRVMDQKQRRFERIALHHYFCKSEEDFKEKMNRSRADHSKPRTMQDFKRWGRGGSTDGICAELSKHASTCCSDTA